jgi:tellurium resistance protein TerD
MAVSLNKGGNVSLVKAAQEAGVQVDPAKGLTKVKVGLGWDARTTTGTDFDLDASALGVKADGKVVNDTFFIFFNNKQAPNNVIVHTGDNKTGEGAGDDESLTVDLAAMPAEVDKIVFPVTIYDAKNRGQNFGQVRNAYIRILDEATGTEIARYDLSEDAATETAMVFGELYRHGTEWKFRAVGTGYANGLEGLAKDFGVNV